MLHAAPEAARGGPLALVRDGDIIELNVEAQRIDLLVDDEELAASRGWRRLYAERVPQADLGADLDFL
ncbi:dihydroxy-acid dehydratase [Kribbella catacumbae]|uniref:dihydroxy-acid dehydratase domain-containing protein n=1 Tax=Kribbella catacumbae TaxID=460086 RepID=UPI0003660C68|nr:dihydroxy-acid dehydratase [Kribbella catacumbae]